jgi:hypothetical protein
MAQCSQCGAETEMYFVDTPICVKCSISLEQENERRNAPHDDARRTDQFSSTWHAGNL